MIHIRTAEGFSSAIEAMVQEKGVDIIDAILYHCEKNQIEIELVNRLLTSSLRKKLQEEARARFLLKKEDE